MEVLMTLQGSQMETDDPITSYMLQAWARLCKCLGQDFLPYMSVVMPPLLQSAQLKPDVTITSVDSDEDIEESDDERHASSLENKRVDLFDGLGGGDGIGDENAILASNPEEMRKCQEEMRVQGVPSLSNLLPGRRN